jgi:hypothetical protein
MKSYPMQDKEEVQVGDIVRYRLYDYNATKRLKGELGLVTKKYDYHTVSVIWFIPKEEREGLGLHNSEYLTKVA